MKQKIALTIKPTMRCNMRCRHCFNGDDLNGGGIVDINEVFSFLTVAAKEYKIVKVTFHGGEPTLAGFDFYKKVFEYEYVLKEKYGTQFDNFFTTNGLLLDDRLSNLLIENNAMINISFDGPYNHILRSNSETVLNNMLMLKRKSARMRAFCTVCNPSYIHLSETYNWFKSQMIDFKILPIEPRGFAKENTSYLMKPYDFVEKLGEVYREWLVDKDCQIRFYTFEEFIHLRPNVQFKDFWFNREIALNPDGRIYPFGRPNDVNYCLGTPSSISSLTECFESGEYLRLKSEIKECWNVFCNNCDSAHICRGVLLCMSYVYGNDTSCLKASCNMSNLIFKKILSINSEVQRDIDNGSLDKYAKHVLNAFCE